MRISHSGQCFDTWYVSRIQSRAAVTIYIRFVITAFSADSTFEGTIKPAFGMETRLSSSSVPSWGQHSPQGSRKMILYTQVRKDSAQVPTREPAPNECRNSKTGEISSCQQPPQAIIIIAGMGCMLLVIIIALLLLLYSFRRHRRRRPENSHEDTAGGLTCGSGDQPIHEGSGDCGDVVLVRLPGDDIPQCFARPSPFKVVSKNQEGTIDEGDKALDESELSGDSEPTQDVSSTHQRVASNDGTHRNPLVPSC